MDVSEEETVDCCKIESPKLQAEPSDYHSVDSSSRQKHSPLFSLTPDEFRGKNLDDLLNKFWDIEGNPVTSNPNQEGQHVSYGAENDMRDDQFFEQVVGDFNGHQYPSDQITPRNENNEISNSNFSEPAARCRRRRLASAEEPIVMDKRQRRMIKNRESAQRSRARKQAYTAELEIELNRLGEENDKLKLLVAKIATSRRQEEEIKKEPTKAQWIASKLRTLRRISSVSW